MEVPWNRAQRTEVRDFVLWLRAGRNPARDRHREGAPAPGSVNARTGKSYLREGYAPATINHALSVISAFYDHHVQAGQKRPSRPAAESRCGVRVAAGPAAHSHSVQPVRQLGRNHSLCYPLPAFL
ncbi:hypothetical protein ACFWBB_40645 [Streptomyces sp. NPDC060000]|uniref:hypothetical protein n=1 Tax=Streptomyces sp. NPDC060000 TaxID=3347031 RepID=UPI00367CD425